MSRRKKQLWGPGDIFGVPLPDGSFAIGQVVAAMMPNVIYCALTDRRTTSAQEPRPSVMRESVVARVAVTREQLDFGQWPVMGKTFLLSEKAEFDNERFASSGYVGAKMYDAALAEDFLAAFHALIAWDDWHDPHYLDAWLVSPDRKPTKLLLKSSAS